MLKLFRRQPDSPRKALFVHVPKTAGISLFTELSGVYGRGKAKRWSDPNDLPDYLDMPDEELRRLSLISGHFSLDRFQQKDIGPRFVFSVIRHPLDRAISMYRYLRGTPQHRLHRETQDQTIDEFLAARSERGAACNAQCRQLSGLTTHPATRDFIAQHYDLVGTVEHLTSFTQALRSSLGVASMAMPHKNRSKGAKLEREHVSTDARDAFMASCSADLALWEYVAASPGHVIGREASRADLGNQA